MKLNECLTKSIEDSLTYEGLDIELNSNFSSDFFSVKEELEKDNLRTYINEEYLNSHMFLYTFANMLKENKINIQFNEKATEKDIDYLKKLSKEFQI